MVTIPIFNVNFNVDIANKGVTVLNLGNKMSIEDCVNNSTPVNVVWLNYSL